MSCRVLVEAVDECGILFETDFPPADLPLPLTARDRRDQDDPTEVRRRAHKNLGENARNLRRLYAWFLMACNPDERLNRPVAAGAPGNAELIDTYQRARRAEVRDLAWFEALVRYKQLAITALLIRNARRRGQENTMGASLKPLQDSARHLLRLGEAGRPAEKS